MKVTGGKGRGGYECDMRQRERGRYEGDREAKGEGDMKVTGGKGRGRYEGVRRQREREI